ncbi:neuraminidase-like domain-containing protein [Ewingella americana]|uniref:Toxin n=1 Tax=Ewingella americana TaxID=41202 RepID=A0A502GGZ5_9GAMM|nr:neuraminidase-like domain-containing protein [Ewingella americana]TPG61557.1 hypothetical protein EAH77_13030 [Ewingella americana]
MNDTTASLLATLATKSDIKTLAPIPRMSFAEFLEKTTDTLSWSETKQLYEAAQQDQRSNVLLAAKVTSRANPQLQSAVNLGIEPIISNVVVESTDASQLLSASPSDASGYQDIFASRDSAYAPSGSVASVFSPASYLTELYTQAKDLHATSSDYHLDKRRPDLQSLTLSQANMTQEVSTLSLSNEIVLTGIKTKTGKNETQVMELLSTDRSTGVTPYHQAFDNVRQSLLLADPDLSPLTPSALLVSSLDTNVAQGLNLNISPELNNILLEEITDATAAALYTKNFGTLDINTLRSVDYLCRYYNITQDELAEIINTCNASYVSNKLVAPVMSEGQVDVVTIMQTPKDNYTTQLNYLDLYPTGKETYNISYSMKDYAIEKPDFKLLSDPTGLVVYYHNQNFAPLANKHYINKVSIPTSVSEKSFNIAIKRQEATGNIYNYTAVQFTVTAASDINTQASLLKLNKVIRLYKASGLSPAVIWRVINSADASQIVNAVVLKRLSQVKLYLQQYAVDAGQALTLANVNISEQPILDALSQFDQLFNNPPLSGMTLVTDTTNIDFRVNTAVKDPRVSSIKRGLNADDNEMMTLNYIVDYAEDGVVICNIGNISDFYRARLLADAHHFSVSELYLLLDILNYRATRLYQITDEKLAEIIDAVYKTTQWLAANHWTVYDLYIMVTDTYSTTLTPEIENLTATLLAGLPDQKATRGDALKHAMAPYIAASLQLASENVAYQLLCWSDQVKPSGITVDTFWTEVQTNSTSAKVITFCQLLAQLAVIYSNTQLSENELALAVTQPAKMITGATALGHSLATLQALTGFHGWINSLADQASDTLTAFTAGALTVEKLADAMNLDKNTLTQALALVQAGAVTTTPLTCWSTIDLALQWVTLATACGIAPVTFTSLNALKYATTTTYTQWQDVANALVAGLNAERSTQLHALQGTLLSDAACGYSLANVISASLNIRDRNALFTYLLIDNQVSADVLTTPLAEAIAGIQLYVNRVLQRIEVDVVTAVTSRTFFDDWDVYNKRYSTWAGKSQLLYYPENYVDPTQRIGQTHMMGELLQSINQSQLNTDTVEDAFKTYLTNFEQVANLSIVSAYHDEVNVDTGFTYFIGASQSQPTDYYWRRVNHDQFAAGSFPANAWSDWLKIECAVNPWQGMIRPVNYKSRLYVLWLERKEQSTLDSTGKIKTTTYNFDLKLSHIRYDGTWTAPFSFSADALIPSLSATGDGIGLYCSECTDEDKLVVLFYTKVAKAADTKTASGISIFADMTGVNMDKTQTNLYLDNAKTQFDTTAMSSVNNRFSDSYSVPTSVVTNSSWSGGGYEISKVYGGNIAAIRSVFSDSSIRLFIKPSVRVCYDAYSAARDYQTHLIKHFGNYGDKFVVYDFEKNISYKDIDMNQAPLGLYHSNKLDSLLIYNGDYSNPWYACCGFSEEKEMLAYNSLNTYKITSLYNSKTLQGDDLVCLSTMENILIGPLGSDGNLYCPNLQMDITARHDVSTTINNSAVTITVKAGSKTQTFTADKNCSTFPAGSLNGMTYVFNELEIDISGLVFTNNKANVEVTFSAKADDNRFVGSETFVIPVTRKSEDSNNILTLHKTDAGAQYIEMGIYRTRLNTLFAHELVSRADKGIDSILSMNTQNIAEPMRGEGFYTRLVLPAYNAQVHGSEDWFKIYLGNIQGSSTLQLYYEGTLSPVETELILFVPYEDHSYAGEGVRVAVEYSAHFYNGVWEPAFFTYNTSTKQATLINDADHASGTGQSGPVTNVKKYKGYSSVAVLDTYQEPMDFTGANALYFWELFYYTPMLVAQRLLQEQSFDESNRWLSYIWDPAGYLVNGQPADYDWNVRPLQEDTSWNSDQLDTTDPDAICQHDPMHYKVSTFMRTLDLLIARGDHQFRMLERDTLAEAKMWYMQALNLLGTEPYVELDSSWGNATLSLASTQTQAALTDLFLPEQNAQLSDYWQTLNQRLFNLRHNLSIDGQPLSLPLYATPADPKALLSAAVMASQGGSTLPTAVLTVHRFPQMLDSARGVVSQLMQFGASLQGIIERQDGEALNQLLQNQARELMLTSISMQDKALSELDAERVVLTQSLNGARQRLNSYTSLFNENVSSGEKRAMDLRATASAINASSSALHMAAAALEMVPNIYGFSIGGARWGGLANAAAIGIQITTSGMMIDADKVSQSEAYRRRRQEWDIQRNNAQSEVSQLEAQQASLAVRREAAVMQKGYLETQQGQIQAQLEFLQRKFSNQALYNWLRGRLAAIFFQFYDLAVSRCLMAERSYQWEVNDAATSFIKPGAWQGTYAGLLCGETLMLNLTQMDHAWLQWDNRALEINRTVSLADQYNGLPTATRFVLADKVSALVTAGKDGSAGDGKNNVLKLASGTLSACVALADLKIKDDYPVAMNLGTVRRIKQVSITLPALVGPYQDVQATLTYGGTSKLPKGCTAVAISTGMNDSGQFQLDFNDSKFLPFEGIDISDTGTLVLSFPNATGKQKALLQSLNDIILHIRYTIR